MKRIFINDCFLKEEDLDFEVIRVKALIVNSKNEILIAHNNNTYQFPGGHKEDNESLEESLTREVKEETGIDINLEMGPFMFITTYDPDYFGTSKKVCNKIYYYRILSDQEPNYEETHYDELECQTDFNLFYIDLKSFSSFLEKSIDEKKVDTNIAREMLLVLREYDSLFGGVE